MYAAYKNVTSAKINGDPSCCTNKGGASHQISSNGVWSFADPKDATKELGQKTCDHMVNLAINFINAWKKVDAKNDPPEEKEK